MKITIELTGVELDALQRALAEENGEYNGKTAEEVDMPRSSKRVSRLSAAA